MLGSILYDLLKVVSRCVERDPAHVGHYVLGVLDEGCELSVVDVIVQKEGSVDIKLS